MTYCLGILVDEGLLLVADTRTNAGLDNVSSYRKLHCLADEPHRQIHLACSGSLSASQSLLDNLLEADGAAGLLAEATSIARAAAIVGCTLRRANAALLEALGPEKSRGGASLLLGGRVGAERPRLFLIYPEGNFIECKRDVPYLQIGETRYGRPILERVVTSATSLSAAVKIALLSFDSAMRSNLAIARPLDVAVIPTAPGRALARRVQEDDAYFNELSRRWSCMLSDAAEAMPEPAFLSEMGTHRPLSVVAELRA